ncbi:ParB/RepB/Spo0J family partition protein [Methylorubrum extorquens]|uniref:ParB/RepB/Spo0J family partition protein n=1 Tax=Methylorubrum extorquens TaxID=408 RepID=UPI0020A06950|nr:ParB/RepB/Spo0J family partition protein [Methylorubrum extorquens]MCP1540080.1 ParB/RepB/Spo0J family partition protein [Methylorubrum extorquens]
MRAFTTPTPMRTSSVIGAHFAPIGIDKSVSADLPRPPMYPKALTLPPTALRPNPWNTNHMSPDNEARLTASVRQHGLFKPVVVREAGGDLEIIGGEHRWKVCLDLGLKEIPVINVGPIADDQAKKIGLIDNARYGEDDASELAALLKTLVNGEEIQDTMPFSDEEITSIFSSSSIALDDLDLLETESETSEPEEVAPAAAAPKTHAMMRFQVPLADAERLTDLITRTAKRQGFEGATALMNAGDALCFLLLSGATAAPAVEDDEPSEDDGFGAPL